MTGETTGSNAGSLAAGNAGSTGLTAGEIADLEERLAEQISLRERLASREIYRYDVKYWTLEQAEAYPLWPPTEGDKMTEQQTYKFHWVGTVKVFDGPRWVASTGIRGVFERTCDETEARLAFDENSDTFMDRDFLSGEFWLDGGGPGTDDWELHWFHVIIVDGPDGEISPVPEGASR